MSVFNLHSELNTFYQDHVRLKADRRSKLAEYRDACLSRLNEGLEKLGDERNTTPASFIRYIGQGSYPMFTLNQHPNDEYDIDVAVIFNKDDLPETAAEARTLIADALLATGGNFRKEPEARTNAVTVWYADGAHVDLAIYREVSGFFGPTLEHAGADWHSRDPEAVTAWFLDAVEEKSPEYFAFVEEKQLRRVVRWVKAFARSRASWSLPGGMIITALVDETYSSDASRDDVSLLETIDALIARLKRNLDVDNPISPGTSLTSKPQTKEQMQALLAKLESMQPILSVLTQQGCTRNQAINAWGKFFHHEYWGHDAEAEWPSESTQAGVARIEIAVSVARTKGAAATPYVTDKALAKGKWIKFALPSEWRALDGGSYWWTVTNSGDEARSASDMGHERSEGAETWRTTKYKGIHTMTCEVLRNGSIIGRGRRRVRVASW